jgi:ATP-dependent DNA ligase
MKAVPFEEKRLLKWRPPYIVQPKYDGDRCRIEYVIGNKGEKLSFLFSSEENIFSSVPHINKQIDEADLAHLHLDGELYSHSLMLEGGHELIHSIVSRTKNLHPRYEEMEFWIFDLKIPQVSQTERMLKLTEYKNLPPNIKIAPFWVCQTLAEIKFVYDRLIDEGYEGIIIRHFDNLYETKRSTMMMKFKPKRKDTYTVIGFNEEVSNNGSPKNRLGSLTLSSQTGDIFNVSAGLNDNDRKFYWEGRGELIGKKAIVHYQHLTNKGIPKGCFNIEIMED